MRRIVFAVSAVVVSSIGMALASGQEWDNKTVEKMLKDGSKKMESPKPDEREDGIGYIQGYIRCSDRAKYQPLLVKALKDTNPKVRVSAVQTLEKLHATDAVDVLIPMLEDPVDDVKERALFTLGSFGTDAKTAVPAIKKAQAAAKAAHKNGLEATTEGVLEEIAGTKKLRPGNCS